MIAHVPYLVDPQVLYSLKKSYLIQVVRHYCYIKIFSNEVPNWDIKRPFNDRIALLRLQCTDRFGQANNAQSRVQLIIKATVEN